ncbi:MAG: hypothetical protein KF850_06710 [Labilithrix sp.]|nr:hypothetical protein [Labilithrix sp.]
MRRTTTPGTDGVLERCGSGISRDGDPACASGAARIACVRGGSDDGATSGEGGSEPPSAGGGADANDAGGGADARDAGGGADANDAGGGADARRSSWAIDATANTSALDAGPRGGLCDGRGPDATGGSGAFTARIGGGVGIGSGRESGAADRNDDDELERGGTLGGGSVPRDGRGVWAYCEGNGVRVRADGGTLRGSA